MKTILYLTTDTKINVSVGLAQCNSESTVKTDNLSTLSNSLSKLSL